MDLQVQNIAFFCYSPTPGGGGEAFPPPKVAHVRDIAFFTTLSRVKSIELYMDLQVQIVAFFTTVSGVRSIELHLDLQVQNVAFFRAPERDRAELG